MTGSVALRLLAVLLLVLGVVPVANLLTAGKAVPWYAGAAREWAERGLLLVLVATLVAKILGDRFDISWDRARQAVLATSSRAFAAGIAVAAFVAAAFVAHWSYAGMPFASDEMAQLFHARVLAGGQLVAHAETAREFFNTAPMLDRDGLWFSQYPIGGPLLLAAGVLLGAPSLVNPVLLGVAALAFYRFLALAADEPAARAAALVFLLSPMVLLMGGSQMNHVAALTFTLVAYWQAVAADAAPAGRARLVHGASSGAAIGLVATVRPLDGALVALAIGAVQAARAMRDRDRWAALAVQAAAGAIPVALLLYANSATTGGPLLFAYDALNGPEHAIGFHLDPNGEEHTPIRGLTYASGYLMRLSLFLFEWPLPGVLICALGLAAVARPNRWEQSLAALMAVVLAGYAAYWFDGFFAGPRFLFAAVPAFVYFAVRAPSLLDAAPPLPRRAARLVIPLCVLVSWLGPWGVSSASSRIALHREQRTKLKTDVEAQVARERLTTPALVFVTEGWRGSLQARLRVLGATSFRAERLLNTLDACALQTALDATETGQTSPLPDAARLRQVIDRARAAGTPRLVPNLPADQAIAIVPGSSPTPTCLAEFSRDSIGTMPFPMFLARQHVQRDGRIGGDIVYARDLGARNERLRARFGERTWYRYRPARGLDDSSRVFLRY